MLLVVGLVFIGFTHTVLHQFHTHVALHQCRIWCVSCSLRVIQCVPCRSPTRRSPTRSHRPQPLPARGRQAPQAQSSARQQSRALFDRLDSNKDGTLDVQEFEAAVLAGQIKLRATDRWERPTETPDKKLVDK